MAESELIKALMEQASAKGSKSNVLKPVMWVLGILFSGIATLITINAPNILIVLVSIFLSLAFLVFLFAFLYCLFKDRDALRSEKYSIQKLAIEKGFIGDSITGQISSKAQNKAIDAEYKVSKEEDSEE